MAAGSHFRWPKIIFNRISRHFRSIHSFSFFWIFLQNSHRRSFWITEDHFRSHLLPFQINMQLFFLKFFIKWPPAAILDDKKNHFRSHFSSFQINAQVCFFWKFLQNGRRRPFWMTEDHFRSHFAPFQINTQLLFFSKWPPAAILDSDFANRQGPPSIICQWLHQLWSWSVHFWLSYRVHKLFHHIFTKWPPAAILVFPICSKIDMVLPL